MRKTPRWTLDNAPSQDGRVAIVTGANSGLGFETALGLAKKGAHVILACRNQAKGQAALAAARSENPRGTLELMPLDLAELASVRRFAAAFLEKHARLDLLVNNAGVMACAKKETADGFEFQLGTNHLGHFALTGLLLERLLETEGSRIVNVSSSAHWFGHVNLDDLMGDDAYSRWGAYGQSKLANLLFTYELQRRLEARGATTQSLSAHPGWTATNLQALPDAGWFERTTTKVGNCLLAQDAEMGALPQLFAAVAPEAKGGDFFAPAKFRQMRGYPVKVASNERSHDVDKARGLWELSEELTGVRFAL